MLKSYNKAKSFIRRLDGEYKQEQTVKEVIQSNNINYIKELINEAFNQNILLGYKYIELCNKYNITPEFPELAKKYWLSFN